MKNYINLLQVILLEIEKEKVNPNRLWSDAVLDDIVIPEISELLKYALKGEFYFKYGKKQRMLESEYHILDSVTLLLNKTILSDKILDLQVLLNRKL